MPDAAQEDTAEPELHTSPTRLREFDKFLRVTRHLHLLKRASEVKPAVEYAHDKAFKLEATRTPEGTPFTHEVQRWLHRYVPPVKRVAPKQSYYECRRTELVQKQERMSALLELRARGLKANARRWPKRCPLPGKENIQAKEAARRARIKAAAEAQAAQDARRAAEARVAHLMALRTAPRK
ncbi:hypothetical protein B0H17DRAFT_1199255 [Mycena rosella]|uniref:Uncharacterized protein n=1 Tax=Mycena rosella TaxID=1033263 RepID=A0AAD7DL90_MYCRO|nr:hypothetical protein B0H17DRAFT_1199255 [Mycena rosella]